MRRGVLALLVLAAAPVRAQPPDFEKVQIVTTKLAEGVYMLEGSGGNMGASVGEDGVFLVDDEYAPLTPKIKAALAALSSKPLRFVLNTHWHFDHTGGNKDMGEAGALLVAHENVRVRMSSEQFIEAFKQKVPPSDPKALPVVTYETAVTFHLNGDEVHAVHLPPGHTDGDSVVHFKKANVIHAGDLFFNGRYPFVDISTGGSLQGMISDADRILAMADDQTKIIPGHGPVGDKAGLRAFRDMLAGIRDKVAPLLKAGKTVEDVVAAKPTKDYDEKWGKGFLNGDGFASMVYSSLAKDSGKH